MSAGALPRVAVVTGGLLTGDEESLGEALARWRFQRRSARAAWLDLKIKLLVAEPLLAGRLERRQLAWSPRRRSRRLAREVEELFASRGEAPPPTLTEVLLVTLLRDAGAEAVPLPVGHLFSRPREAETILAETDCVFLSSTYIHDLSELMPLVERLKRPHNRIVVGGALAALLEERWDGMEEVDVLAVGYGEALVPSLVAWMRSGFEHLEPPPGGRVLARRPSTLLASGTPETKSLDLLPGPDWTLAAGGSPRTVYYESVRGCPFRCAFCNYPYLFADRVFRTKSAEHIADDWERYARELGVREIICLDSLFTVPKARLVGLCERLIRRRVRVRWSCYARADDLVDEELVALLIAAGAHQVQIGIESGDPEILTNMAKQVSPEANARALDVCRRQGLTTVVSLIVGFPGETEESLERTSRLLEAHPPDFYFLATFSTRVEGVPILAPASARRFGLEVSPGLYTMAPYWRHRTMSCDQAANHVRRLDHRLMAGAVALNAALFYRGLGAYRPEHRPALLEMQRRAAVRHPILRAAFTAAHHLIDRNLRREMGQSLRPPAAIQEPAPSASPP